jgi:hypothetical protein
MRKEPLIALAIATNTPLAIMASIGLYNHDYITGIPFLIAAIVVEYVGFKHFICHTARDDPNESAK